MHKWDRTSFRQYLNAVIRYPWLNDVDGAFESLLYEDCRTEEERNMVLELLPHFLYLTGEQFSLTLRKFTERIVEDGRYTDETCQVVAMTHNSKSDSGEFVLYYMKPIFQKLGWMRHKLVNRSDHAFKTHRDSPRHKHIILVDEFAGTGQTVLRTIQDIDRVFARGGVENYSIRARVLVALESGVDLVNQEGYELLAEYVLPKGISGRFPAAVAEIMIAHMLQVENRLAPEINGHRLPSLGYMQSEGLYGRKDGNAPNNVFPVFWWPSSLDSRKRKTVLTRAMVG